MDTLFFKICCCYVIGYVVFYILVLFLSEMVFSSFEHTTFDKIVDFTFCLLSILLIPAVIGIVISLFLHYAF